jgi:hypothetical protein
MTKLHSKVCYVLRDEALSWLVERNPSWTRPGGTAPCPERIAAAAGINSSTLTKALGGTIHEVSQRLMASLVMVSGAPRAEAEERLFDIVTVESRVAVLDREACPA